MTYLFPFAVVAFAVGTAGHALLYKRDARAVIAWVAFIVMVPIVGAALYWLLAVNRIQRRATVMRPKPAGRNRGGPRAPAEPPARFLAQSRVGDYVTPFELTAGNSIELLEDGDHAFPAMLASIEGARSTIGLASYIFDVDPVGLQFRDALAAAVKRGVEVRVLIDAVGAARLHGDGMVELLKQAGVYAAEFLPVARPLHMLAFNLRNHRKVLVVDGEVAFTGSMNITVSNRLSDPGDSPMRDVQFRVRGPLVAQLQHVFVDDWAFATAECLKGDAWFPPSATAGKMLARTVPDGPDEQFESLRMVLYGALAEAGKRVAVVTPYFLPDASLIGALNTAALRGVRVDIVLPESGDNRVVHWASRAQYWQLLERGCHIWHSPSPFDHSKVAVIDDVWTLVGTSNWDPRSLRLNFEVNIEVFDEDFGACMGAWVDSRLAAAREVTKAEVDARRLPVRLRDGAARLLIPYL